MKAHAKLPSLVPPHLPRLGAAAAAGLLVLSAGIASAAPPKIQFAFLLFPDDVKVDVQRDFTFCLVNVGQENSLSMSEGDAVTLSIPLGDGPGELADAVGVLTLSCTAPADWTCSVDLSDPERAAVVLEPDPEVQVPPLETFCFDITDGIVNSAQGLVFTEVDQEIHPQRALAPLDPILPVFKSLEGTIFHDDLAEVTPDQHHPQTWELLGEDIRTLYGGDVVIGPLGGAQAKLTVNQPTQGDALRVRTGGVTSLFVAGDGQVGIGNAAPAARLEVHSRPGEDPLHLRLAGATEPELRFRADGKLVVGETGGVLARLTVDSDPGEEALRVRVDGTTRLYVGSTGNVGVGTASPSSPLEVDGKTTTGVLEITGGSDLAEHFDVGGDVSPGMVVRVDPERPGRLEVASRAYDRSVVGVVSGAGGLGSGMVMAQAGSLADGDHPVALSGRVFCLADESHGEIEPGDLLTSSDVPGHCMKAKKRRKAHGAVLGKALGSVEDGLVLVLVSLQ